MSFLWPGMLWLLLIVPLLAAGYVYLLRRRKRHAVRYANLLIVKQALGGRAGLRRHIPPVLLLAALTVTIIAVARPEMVIITASNQATVLLAMDVSGSMRADDIEPSRIEASRAAARAFVASLPRDVSAGIVAFAGTAFLVQQPTVNRDDLISTIDSVEIQRGTAIGSAILVALQTLFGEAGFDLGRLGLFMQGRQGLPLDEWVEQPEPTGPPPGTEPGSYQQAIVILLTDGRATTGPDPIEAARMAADWGVRVFTVGFGSAEGTVVEYAGQRRRSQLDEETLRQIAEITRGQYFLAATASELESVYDVLNRQFIVETERTEVTALFAALAGLLSILAAGLSFAWFSRIL
jgi:Ca-activated chloride channel family protein